MLKKKKRGVRKWESAFMQKKFCPGFRTVEGGFCSCYLFPLSGGRATFFLALMVFLVCITRKYREGLLFLYGFSRLLGN